MSSSQKSSMDEEKGGYDPYDDATSTSSTPFIHGSEQEASIGRRQNSLASRCPTILHWTFHLLSAIAITYLAIRLVSRETTVECWDRFNAYSELLEQVVEYSNSGTDQVCYNSSDERVCKRPSIRRSRNQWVKALPK